MKRSSLVVVALALGSTLAFAQAPTVVPKPSAPVVVTNPPSAPVPVTLQGTGAISGTVNIGNVVRTQDDDNAARLPFQDSFSLQIDPGKSSTTNNSFKVNIPANSRLAIERINVLGEMPVGQALIGVTIDAFVDGSASGNFLGTTFRGTSPSGVIFFGPLDIYSGDGGSAMFADAGDNNISLSAFRSATAGTGHVFVQVFGHVVPLP
jgi:hypothetical protein